MNIKSFEQTPVSLWEVNRPNVQRLKDALTDCITEDGAGAIIMGGPFAERRLREINRIVNEALKASTSTFETK